MNGLMVEINETMSQLTLIQIVDGQRYNVETVDMNYKSDFGQICQEYYDKYIR